MGVVGMTALIHAHAAIRRERHRLTTVLEAIAADGSAVPLSVQSQVTTAINELADAEGTIRWFLDHPRDRDTVTVANPWGQS